MANLPTKKFRFKTSISFLFRRLLTLLRRLRFLRDDLPFGPEGLRIKHCGFRPNMEITIQCTHVVSPSFPNQTPPGRYPNSLGVRSDGNGCVDAVWGAAVTVCQADPEARLEIKFKHTYLNEDFFDLIVVDCGGRRIG